MKETKQMKVDVLKKRAKKLYEQNFSTRDIGKWLGRSHTWVAEVVKEEKK